MNSFSTQCEILSELWLDHRDEDEFEDFLKTNHLAVALAHMVAQGLAKVEERGEIYISEAWGQFLEDLNADPNLTYHDLDDLLDNSDTRDDDGSI